MVRTIDTFSGVQTPAKGRGRHTPLPSLHSGLSKDTQDEVSKCSVSPWDKPRSLERGRTRVDYESRKKAVLSAAINKYIKGAVPVASEDIADDFALSSATIRNVFAELEEEGYLMHPYTSAGRIPTAKGYRYYVDFLILQLELIDKEKECIARECKKQTNRLEDVLERTSEVLSGITHYASIVSFPEWQDKFFYKGIGFILEQPEFQDFRQLQHLIKVLEDRQRLLDVINRDFKEKVRIYIGEELEYAQIDNCALAISRYCIKNRPTGRLAVLGPMRMDYHHIIPTLEYVSDILTDVLNGF